MAASPALAPAAYAAAPGRFHRPELDVLRFGAFFLVFLHHALPHAASAYPTWGAIPAAIGRAGALGVDLFFTLSAYLITEILLREQHTTGSIHIRAFYARRILRIWPLYFFALLLLAPLMGGMPQNYFAAFLLLAGNWACAWWGYPASPFALLWSVSIEEQFYLAWPWIARWRRNLGPALVAMLAVAWITRLSLAMTGSAHPAVWCNTLARLDPIALGALLAWRLDGRAPTAPAPARAALIAAGLAGLLAAGAAGEHAGWHAVWTYPTAAFACLLILYGALCSRMRSPALEYLGKISFGLYVFHAAALELVEFAPAALVLTIAAAALSYRFLESPFLRWKQRLARVPSRPV